MTTIQLAQRLARYLSHTDLATMPVAGVLDLQDAMNAGTQELWRLLPPNHRTATLSECLKAPETITVSMVARYSNLLSADAFDAEDHRGCTVRISDDPRDNEVTGAGEVRDAFLGTTLSGNATLWHDSLQIYDSIVRILGDPRIYRADGTWATLARGRSLVWEGGVPLVTQQLRIAAQPSSYTLESVGVDQLGDSQFYFKVYPMPDVDYIVRFEAELAPRNITFANVANAAVDLPVRENLVRSMLVPLCEEHLLRSPLWADRKLIGLIQDAAERARRGLRNIAGDIGLPCNQVGTPMGF